jgi:hypothetical protein
MPRDDYRLMLSIPVIGKVLTATILLKTSNINRFPGPGNYDSFARCVSSEKASNRKTKSRGNRKNGNKYMAGAFMEAVHYSAIWSPEIEHFYEKRKAKVPILVANKTVSNKLAQPIYHMLKRREPFDETRAFGCVFPWRTVSLGLATSPVILIAVAMAT